MYLKSTIVSYLWWRLLLVKNILELELGVSHPAYQEPFMDLEWTVDMPSVYIAAAIDQTCETAAGAANKGTSAKGKESPPWNLSRL